MHCAALCFTDLSAPMAYAVWQLRQQVFVVEQQCPYPDLDGRDAEAETRHVLLVEEDDLLGYARVLEASYDDQPAWRIGRVVLAPRARGRGLGDLVMHTALSAAPGRVVVLDAQAPLAGWYATFGFEVNGPEFLEDDIAHLPMMRPA